MHREQPAHIACAGLGWFPKTPGGLDRYVYELTYHLATAGDRVDLYALGLPDAANFPARLINLADEDNSLWQRLQQTRRNFLSGEKPDAINLHFALYSLPILNKLPKKVPVTFTFHGPWALESKAEGANQVAVFLKKWLVEKQVYRRSDRFIVLSKAFGEILHQEYQVPEAKIHIIPGGVDLTRFQSNLSRTAARTQLGWGEDRLILFTPRRLVNRMGLDKLLIALSTIKAKVPQVWLAIAGKGPLQATLSQQAEELGLADNVKLLGFLPDEQLPLAYQAADLTVMPSQSLEGFGLTLLESLASGTPVMCTPIGGMPEVIAPFSPDLVTDSGEVEAIAERLAAILTGQIALPSREACRQYAAANFDWHKIAQQVRQVLLA
ncbi:glycosyltransferase family 4 protein [Aliterella atlantica]|uniref:Group 1 glycosyl transferase n=1 Tax=Aliterella atlantica CENA595 TaxID=1618023 RepID=A0A0D8ZMJ4_9CYAN|nr:glycosyltransferase family 4 protein [Aliterella atlantica]KJH69965.1 group 1 glycosyl transferase [Aliterella atlantica CENA595]